VRRERPICPRCGEPFSYVSKEKRGFRYYYYAVHEYYSNGKRTRHKCYLGPVDEYIHVSDLHREREGLILYGLINKERALEYFDVLVSYIAKEIPDLSPEKVRYVIDRLDYLKQLIEKYEKRRIRSRYAISH